MRSSDSLGRLDVAFDDDRLLPMRGSPAGTLTHHLALGAADERANVRDTAERPVR